MALQCEELRPVVLFEAVDRRYVRMVQRGEQLGLALEPRQSLGILGKAFEKHFDRHLAPEFGVARTVNFSLADLFQDRVVREARADHVALILLFLENK